MNAKVRVEKLVYGGAGLARHGDATVFVPFVLPGEEVEVDLPNRSGGILHGSVTAWVEQSAERTEPPCPVFGRCGGCHYQHVSYDDECRYKVAILRETLRRIGGLRWDDEIEVASADPWGYRNRTQFHLDRRDGKPTVGFLASRSHRHVDAVECPINSPKLNELHRTLREMAADRRFPQGLRSVEFFTDGDRVQMNLPRRPGTLPRRFWSWCSERLGVAGVGAPLDYASGPDVFRVSGRSFFQVNRFLADKLAELALGETEGQLALDLYCGVGLLTLPLARRYETVVGVDSAELAMRDLQSNATRARLGVRAVHLGVAHFLQGFSERPELIVADPPRAGLGGEVVKQILRLGPPELRLVSCDPATLARDIKLLGAGGYAVESIHLIDMFPQTFHIETVGILRRR